MSKSVGHEPTLHQTQDKTHKELDKDHDKIGLKSDPAASLVKNSSDASDKGVEDGKKGNIPKLKSRNNIQSCKSQRNWKPN